MKRMILKSLVLAGVLATTAVPMVAGAEGKPAAFQVQMAGAIAVPGQEAENGIIQGGTCSGDVHLFDKSGMVLNEEGGSEPEHIVFAVHVDPQAKSTSTFDISDVKEVKVFIYGSGNNLVTTLPLFAGPVDPNKNPNTGVEGTRFFVNCLFLNESGLNQTGDFSYKFEATVVNPTDGKTHVRQWVPSNNKFTVIDSKAK